MASTRFYSPALNGMLVVLSLALLLGCQPAPAPSPTAAPSKPAEAKPTEAAKPAAKPAASPATAAAAPAAAPAASPAAATAAKPVTGVQPGIPGRVEVVVHTDPGGGGHLVAREIIEMLKSEKLIDGTWTVNNASGGASAKAQAYLQNQKGRSDLLAAVTSVWLATPLTSKEVKTSYTEFTPIARLLIDVNVVAVRADSPYKTMKDFIDAAKAKPNEINQAGGSVTSQDNLAREVLQKLTGAQWNFLSFPGGGERIAALLGGNADLIISQPPEISEQVRAGKLRVIATVGDKRLETFPDIPTLAEQGYAADFVATHRGIWGPPNMPGEAVSTYGALIKRLVDTDTWKQYVVKNDVQAAYLPSGEYKTYLDKENGRLDQVLTELGMKAQ